MTVLIAVVAFWFWLERKTRWKLFEFLPPLIFIYASPVLLSNLGVIPFKSEAYDFLRHYGLPMFIVLMLIKVDVIGGVLAYTGSQSNGRPISRCRKTAGGRLAHWREAGSAVKHPFLSGNRCLYQLNIAVTNSGNRPEAETHELLILTLYAMLNCIV